MLVYGDVEWLEYPAALRAAIADSLAAAAAQPPGWRRHAMLVDAFIRAGELVQGLADAEFEIRGADELSATGETGGKLLLALARMIVGSWESGFAAAFRLPPEWPAQLESLDLASAIRTRRAEGYAFYALYPESYSEAARRSGLGPDTAVIGIRSIGTGLAAMVAAALGAAPAVTLRPAGHPFARRVEIAPALAARILARPEVDFAIVDEGPGLSGSSFGGVADWLLAHGIDEARLHFFPGHDGEPGPEAGAGLRQLWARRPRHSVGLDSLLLRTSSTARRLESWVADLVGPPDGPLQDISGGAWRALRQTDEGSWPPADGQLEQRKFLARAGGTTWLVKFAGLGAAGASKLHKARLLAEGGHTPEIAGLCHGFLVQRWLDAPPLEPARVDRRWLVERVGQYLGFRARRLPAAGGGAPLPALFAMAVGNTGEALGPQAAARLQALLGDPRRFDDAARPVDTDGRLHVWEWLGPGDGRLIKTDALDHSAAHDLVGCQDIAWDVAGAGVELALARDERTRLADTVSETTGHGLDPELAAVLEPCYAAFQLGLWTYAAANATGTEAARANAAVRRYADHLEGLIERPRRR